MNMLLNKLLLWVTKRELAKATLMDSKGKFIQPFNPECTTLDLEIVSLALSRIMRFFGQTKLSVAQHSVNMARVFIYKGEIHLAKQALLHEVSEAFMGDLASPLKKAFPLFKELEESIIQKTFKCYDLQYPIKEEVHVLDKNIVINEAMLHMPYPEYWKSVNMPLSEELIISSKVELSAWTSEKAHEEFMELAKFLNLLD